MAKKKKIYLVDADKAVTEDGRGFYEMTDEEVINASYTSYDSIENFLLDFNADLLDSSSTYAKLI
jgi:hypothetical protein